MRSERGQNQGQGQRRLEGGGAEDGQRGASRDRERGLRETRGSSESWLEPGPESAQNGGGARGKIQWCQTD